MYRAPPQSTDKHFTGRPSYDISQSCAYGSGGELSPSCQQLEISEQNTSESTVTMLNAVSMGFKALSIANVTPLAAPVYTLRANCPGWVLPAMV